MAHLFINYMLDAKIAAANFSFIGYQPPQRRIVPDKLVSDGFLPRNLAPATVLARYFNVGIRLLQLPDRRRPDLAPDLAELQGRWLSRASAAPTAGRSGPSLAAARAPSGWPCSSWRRCTSSWPSCSARSTRSSASPCRCGTRCSGTSAQFHYVFSHIVGAEAFFGPALLRTLVYVLLASSLCLLVAYPVAYFTARFAGRHRGLILTLLIAPFWISYMMRMLAWVNLLQNDGLVNRTLSLGGLFHVNVDWLSGHPSTVVLGLVYGYVPYMILPLFAGLDRIQASGWRPRATWAPAASRPSGG